MSPDNLNDASNTTDDTKNGSADGVHDTENVAGSNDQNDGGQNLEKGSGDSTAHADDIDGLVRPVDGETLGNGHRVHGVIVGDETVWDETKGELVATGKKLVAWFRDITAVEPESLEKL